MPVSPEKLRLRKELIARAKLNGCPTMYLGLMFAQIDYTLKKLDNDLAETDDEVREASLKQFRAVLKFAQYGAEELAPHLLASIQEESDAD